MNPWDYQVKLLFLHKYVIEGIEPFHIEEGEEFWGEGYPKKLVMSDLPRIGEIVRWREESHWIVSAVLHPLVNMNEIPEDAEPPYNRATLLLYQPERYAGLKWPDVYVGLERRIVGKIGADCIWRPLMPRNTVGEFNWGYLGSGPYDLAYAMLYDHFGEIPSHDLVVQFREHFIAPIKKPYFVISSVPIDEWLSEITPEEPPEDEFTNGIED